MSKDKPAIHAIFWTVLFSGMKAVLQFGVLAILARKLNASDYGLGSAILILIGVTTLLSQLGVTAAIVQLPTITQRHLETGFFASVCSSGLMSLGAILCAGVLSNFIFHLPDLENLIKLISICFVISGASVAFEGVILRKQDFKIINKIEIISYAVGYLGFAIPGALAGWGVHSLIIGIFAHLATRSIFLFFFSGVKIRPIFHMKEWKELSKFGGRFTTSQIINYTATNLDSVLVGRLMGAVVLGNYTRAYQIIVAPSALIGDSIDRVMFPVLSRVSDKSLLPQIFSRGIVVTTVLVLPLSFMIHIVSADIICVLLGEKWMAVAAPLSVFSLALYFRTLPKFFNSFIKAAGEVRILVICQSIYLICVFLGVISSYRAGVTAVATGVLIAIVIFCLAMGIWASMIAKIEIVKVIKELSSAVIFSLITYFVMRWIHGLIQDKYGLGIRPLLSTSGGGAALMVIYIIMFPKYVTGLTRYEIANKFCKFSVS